MPDAPGAAERRAPPQVVVATAGHVDHGKSALVRALTGTDPDRLPEERARGMTIELGFAFLRGGDVDLGFVDCPGHERYVHHLVSGVGAVDGCVLVIAADEGPREQTREHLDILRLLRLRWGRVVVTKSDLVDDAALSTVRTTVAAFVAGTPFAAEPPLAVSARTGAGLDALRDWLLARARDVRRAAAGEHARLAIDRVFTVAGHGTVATGTLRAGAIAEGDELEVLPGGRARVRSLQVDRRPVDRAVAGQRVAVNLAGIAHEAVRRGAWLATPGALAATTEADARLTVLPPGLAHRDRVVVHHGTGSAFARVHLLQAERADDGEHDAQLRLESPLYLAADDLVLLRRASPAATLAGGAVLDPRPPRHRRFAAEVAARFAARAAGGVERLLAHLAALEPAPATLASLIELAGGPGPAQAVLRAAGERVVVRAIGDERLAWSADGRGRLLAAIPAAIAARQRANDERCWHGVEELRAQLAPTMPRPAWDDAVAELVAGGTLRRAGSSVCAPASAPPLPRALRDAAAELLDAYDRAGFHPPYDHPAIAACSDPERAARALAALRERGRLMALTDRLHLHRRHGERLIAAVLPRLDAGEAVDIAWMKSAFALTRRDAVPLLEWLDAVGVTRRLADARVAGGARALTTPLLGTDSGGGADAGA